VYTKDDELSQRRHQIQLIIASGDPQHIKNQKIDKCIKEWGKKYFNSFDMLTGPNEGQFKSRWQTLSGDQQVNKIAKKLNMVPSDVRDIAVQDDQTEFNQLYILQSRTIRQSSISCTRCSRRKSMRIMLGSLVPVIAAKRRRLRRFTC
jgi:hypothetical protein